MAMDKWLKWHSALCNNKVQLTDGIKYGSDYEAREVWLAREESN
jgi:hypothetical protein